MELESGKIMWTSEKLLVLFSMPNIYRSGDKVIVQVGGKVQVQSTEKEQQQSFYGGTYTSLVPYIYWDYKAQKINWL